MNMNVHSSYIRWCYGLCLFQAPSAGVWTLKPQDTVDWEVVVTAESQVDVTTKFTRMNVKTGFGTQIDGQPVAGMSNQINNTESFSV